MYYVIGSGPAGISAAVALLERGFKVTMLDVGLTLESEREALVNKRSESTEFKEMVKLGSQPTSKGVPEKKVYGSTFHFDGVEKHQPKENHPDVILKASYAKAGLSNVWGAAVLPYTDQDISSWPISSEELTPHYKAVHGFMPLSADKDDLIEHFPIHAKSFDSLRRSSQMEELSKDLNRGKQELKRKGFIFGSSRLAVKAKSCTYCGLCLYGCPHSIIYSTATTLSELVKDENFSYQPGWVVKNIEKTGDKVLLHCRDFKEESYKVFDAERVFLAAGAYPTTSLILNSLREYGQTRVLKTNQHFLLPLLRLRAAKNITNEKLCTLSQLFLEFLSDTPEQNSHIQLYGYSDFYPEAFRAMLGSFHGPLKQLLHGAVLPRMVVAQGYLHSDYSAEIELSLAAQDKPISVKPLANSRTKAQTKFIVNKLLKISPQLKAIPALPMLNISKAGDGTHVGGSFPMSKNPRKLETNTLGALGGLERVHLVDSTTFPSVPPTTITYSVMANAHRIAATAPA